MELKHKIAKGFLWLAAGAVLNEGLKFSSKIILARLLQPADFGLMALVLFIITCISLFQEAGLENALIQREGNIAEAANAVFMITPVIGIALSFILFLASGSIASFYKDMNLSLMLKVVSPIFLIASFRTVQSGLLEKNLDFRSRFKAEITAVTCYAAVSVSCAFAGLGAWSLIYGYLGSVLVTTIMLWIVSPWRPNFKFDYKIAKSLFSFGKHILGIGIVAFIFSQGDVAFIGRVLSKSQVGYYVMAYTFANITSVQITHMVARVLYPVFSSLQNDKKKLKDYFLQATKYLMAVVVPSTIGILVLSRHIPRLLGRQWDVPVMSQVLRILCFFAFFRSLHIISSILLQAIGKPGAVTKLVFFQLIAMILLIYPFTSAFGIIGTALTMALILAVAGIWLFKRAGSLLGLGIEDISACFRIPLISGIMMGLIITLFSLFLNGYRIGVQITVLVFSGAIFYFAGLYFLDRGIFKKGMSFFTAMFAKNM